MNKITFCSHPDVLDDTECYGLKNYSSQTIKTILNDFDKDTVFYLIEENSPNEWLNTILKKVKIIFDCNKVSLQQINTICQKK